MMTREEAIKAAADRGRVRGETDHPGEGWLSGEWAGCSVPELLGDLVDAVPGAGEDPESDLLNACCEAYEDAADQSYALRGDAERAEQARIEGEFTVLTARLEALHYGSAS